MIRIGLRCAGAATLFYEPDGLLLRACLIPVDDLHCKHFLTFQLGYLGTGEIAVDLILDGEVHREDGRLERTEPRITSAVLRGAAPRSSPGVTLTYVSIPDGVVRYRYTVCGQPGSDNDLRGELSVEVTGKVPLLTATTTAGVTSAPIPDVMRDVMQVGCWLSSAGRDEDSDSALVPGSQPR